MKFPLTHQLKTNDCGPACLKMIADYYGLHFELDFLKKKFRLTKAGVSMLNMKKTASAIGLSCRGVKLEIEKLKELVQQGPAILLCNENHFVVLYRAPKPKKIGNFYLADPAFGSLRHNEKEFLEHWIPKKNGVRAKTKPPKRISDTTFGYALLLELV